MIWPKAGGLRAVFRRVSWVYALVPAVAIAALALAYYGLRYAQELSRGGEQLILETNRELAEGLRKRIEQIIVDSDQTLFDLVDLRNLREFPQRWSDVIRLSPAIESAVVLDAKLKIVPDGFVSKKRSKEEVDAFRALFESRIVSRLNLGTMLVDEHRHLHEEFDGRYYLLSSTRRWSQGESYYIVLEADLAYLVGEVFPDSFSGVDARRIYQVVDETGRIVFGYPFSGIPSKYEVTVPFASTLSRFSLKMAPRDAPALQQKARWYQGGLAALIVLSATIVLVGVFVITLGIREERKTSQLKSDFIANVSHELKTPLSLIRMFGELLATSRVRGPEEAAEYASIIMRESERLTHLIDNVLDLARIERGKSVYRFESRDLGEVVRRALEIASHRLEQVGMTLTVKLAPGLPAVLLDESAMTLALLNLIDNAAKYAAEGRQVHVAVTAERGRQVITVTDHGPGIPPGSLARVFERFYRVPSARQQSVRGSGIGLSLVQEIAHAHGGEASATSTPGAGAAFRLWIPNAGA